MSGNSVHKRPGRYGSAVSINPTQPALTSLTPPGRTSQASTTMADRSGDAPARSSSVW